MIDRYLVKWAPCGGWSPSCDVVLHVFFKEPATKMGFDSIVPSVLNFFSSLSSPIQFLLLIAVVFVIRKIVKSRFDRPQEEEPEVTVGPFNKKRDFTSEELQEYDGVKSPHVLMAVNGKVFDVTRAKDFYGPGK